jgi:hypothetical protein
MGLRLKALLVLSMEATPLPALETVAPQAEAPPNVGQAACPTSSGH